MGSMEEHLGGNAMSISSLRYQLRDLWRSPRGTVLRIEALALVAITLSFFLAFFGSCRRWSNRWIVQKGFLAAQVLSLSLGTYSIGLMQSSPVKNQMYPIWAVSILTLFGCVDPITTYVELDYKGPLSKMIFQLCLYFGYVMLMSVSTIASVVGKIAIVFLSTITFTKGFHRALAFVLPGQLRGDMEWSWIRAAEPAALVGDVEGLQVYMPEYIYSTAELITASDLVTMEDIQKVRLPKQGTPANGMPIKDVCLSYSFSHLSRRRFLGLDSPMEMEEKLMAFQAMVRRDKIIDYKWALKVVEVELAFLFDAFFTSNEFLHLYQAKTGTFWALASFIGICFVGVVAAISPAAIASHHNIINSAANTTTGTSDIVGTTTADLIVTLVILVSLALLQLVQLIRCWTSNWARVSIACEYATKAREVFRRKMAEEPTIIRPDEEELSNTRSSRWVLLGLRLFLVNRVNWFDKYLWQARLGQDSLAALLQRRKTLLQRRFVLKKACCCGHCPLICLLWLNGLGMRYFWVVVRALLLSDTTNPGGAVKLHDNVKTSIAEFLGKIKSRRIGTEWSALFIENGLQDWLEYLPYTNTSVLARLYGDVSDVSAFTRRVMVWHVATWYCEEAEIKTAVGGEDGSSSSSSNREKNRRVAMDLSKYCVYLVVSAPELLPGPAAKTKKALEKAQRATESALRRERVDYEPGLDRRLEFEPNTLEAMQKVSSILPSHELRTFEFVTGVYLGQRLRNEEMKTPPVLEEREFGRILREGKQQSTRRSCSTDHWELLALLWVQTLLYAAPYGDVQAHMQRLAQGGEFITHLWALLYHLGIDKWEGAGIDELKGAAAAAAAAPETRTMKAQAGVQEDAPSGGSEIEEMN